jgi:deoxyribodipyrimidine photo-lyase
VPVEVASDKQEWAARTIRSKINRHRDDFIQNLKSSRVGKSSLPLHVTGDVDFRHVPAVLRKLSIDRSVAASSRFTAGTGAAKSALTHFLRHHLDGYADARNAPDKPRASRLSPYLHFGQISPVEIAAKTARAGSGTAEDKEAFLEELIVRRELAVNFVYFCTDYDKYACLPDWASRTLEEHRDDPRPARYTRQQLENASTNDPYWNAAMQEMLKTGYMHNYMRMYWGKKIIEWTNTPEYAYSTALYLNNKYFLDGRDPNSYANVAWLFGLHDRAWAERDVFGKVRYMSASGLESKFDIDAYVKWVDSI